MARAGVSARADCYQQPAKATKVSLASVGHSSMRAETPSIAAPAFPRGLPWANVATLRMDQQQGKVVLVEFWDFCRVNSLRTLPYLRAWHERYAQSGLRITGVHTGGFAPARVEANVRDRKSTRLNSSHP